jgi:hypothetical protein
MEMFKAPSIQQMIGFDGKCYQVGDTVELHSDVRRTKSGAVLRYTPELRRQPEQMRGVVRRGYTGRSGEEVHVEIKDHPGRLFSGAADMFRGVDVDQHLVERLTWTPDHDQKKDYTEIDPNWT